MDHSFGTWIKRRRKALDLTQQELAKHVGCSPSLIFKIESDERRPSRQIAVLLAEKLEIPADQHVLFLKVARQEKNTGGLDVIPTLSALEPATPHKHIPANLPIPPTSLVGRENEIRVIIRQLLDPACRMLTLTGPGGVGKTRLAIEVGHQVEPHFTDGVYFISLAGTGMTESIVPEIADALGLAFSGPAEPIVQVVAFLRNKKILLVIDNIEHLVEGGNLLGKILQQTQGVEMLLTSREQLRLQWEWLFEVQGLPIPEAGSNLENNSAVSLFVQRARQISQNFSLESDDKTSLAKICKMVGGLPLAIELAASWIRTLSCLEIAQELEASLDLLETKKLDVPERHRSIKTVFDHSWSLLTDEERAILKNLSVFQGGFTREAAISTTGASLSVLSSLVDKSLLRHSKNPDRYELHELIRQYTLTQLRSVSDEEVQISEKHALYYADWMAALEGPFKSEEQLQISQLIRSETSNWLAGWHWAVENDRLDILRKMSSCLNWYFEVHGFYDEALSAFKAALDHYRRMGAPGSLERSDEKSAFAGLLDQVGWFEFRKGNVEGGATLLAESLEIAREYNDPEILYYIYGNWGYLSLIQGNIPEAGRLTTESLNYGKVLNSPWHTAIPISVLGIVAYQQGNLKEAYQQLTKSLNIWRSVGDPRGLVFCMIYLGMTSFGLNDYSMTRSILDESNAIAEANMDRWAHAFGLDMLGMVALAQGQNEEAMTRFTQSIALSREIGDQFNCTQTMIHLGQAYTALNSKEEARRLFLEVYTSARQNKWKLIILNILISYLEMSDELPGEKKLAVVISILAHPSVTPNVRTRCEEMREKLEASLLKREIEYAETLAREKGPENWAEELLEKTVITHATFGMDESK